MAKYVVIVESPSKCAKIQSYLGSDYRVLASFGHIRNLEEKNKGIDYQNQFKLNFVSDPAKQKKIKDLVTAAKAAQIVYLASDPDREGEGIAWHVEQVLKKNGVKGEFKRITFNEITKSAVTHAVQNPRQIDMNLVNAYFARLCLDYMVGFNLSPLLWKKVATGTSAGRVQSPGVKLIDTREEEIKSFNPEEFWNLYFKTEHLNQVFKAKLFKYNNQTLNQFDINSEADALKYQAYFLNQQGKVLNIKKTRKQRKPVAPFITSTLQQAASSRLGFNSDRTMKAAQSLYEKGYITYMRTDSVNLSQEGIDMIRDYIRQNFSVDDLPSQAIMYKGKSKNAQEAHEAIRPTKMTNTPTLCGDDLPGDLQRLYELIWKRSLACQMANAIYDATSVEIEVEKGLFKATGQTLIFKGFLKAYEDVQEDQNEDEENAQLPELSEGLTLPNLGIETTQHFTKAPPRFNEASLVKALEEHGIGRPSTYASIISTIKNREYVKVENKRFEVTPKGHLVNQYLSQHFGDYINFDFTAKMEDMLDEIASGNKTYLEVVGGFWDKFHVSIKENSDKEVENRGVLEVLTDICPTCQKHHLVKRMNRKGNPYIACSGYPECKHVAFVETPKILVEGQSCPKCQSSLELKTGFKGKKYHKCTNCDYRGSTDGKEFLPKLKLETGLNCNGCKKGKIVIREGRGGKFFACDNFPKHKKIFTKEEIQTLTNKTIEEVEVLLREGVSS